MFQLRLYNIEFDYFAPKGTTQSPQRIIHVDGELQYIEAGMFGLPRIWRDDLEKGEKPKENNVGDQIRPRQVQTSNGNMEEELLILTESIRTFKILFFRRRTYYQVIICL